MTVTSGWRSPQFQQQLLDDAIARYGSYLAARR
ncbi:carboxypeptidase, partial [Mycolicibacterium insubricum]|nr:carboxypeptidase [Mycolicibacterium insubricum]